VNISLLMYISPSGHVSMYCTERLYLTTFRETLFLVTLLKIVIIFGFLQKSESYVALVDTYVYLLRYIAVIGFIIYRDIVLY